MKQKLIIGLGSNWERETHIQRANKLLKDYFEEIHFSEAIYTVPIGLQDSALFLNQVAIAYTNYSMEVVQAELKEME
ncbi:MAG: 2-amino-4-hydroxy-6-hydroxymethyldihydropteridine diphosphokinase, partial [Parabacteroides sp.]|nr:2-amino-4-hydroxy-6-hydroxymethyldihydropteridine diphosphokinase [Parabacteroides sp.]